MRRLALTATSLILAAAAPALVQAKDQPGDPEAGARVFAKCRACHQVGETAKNNVGPNLNGLFGRRAGSIPGFAYSAANRESDIVWSPENFAAYIRDPKAAMPGNRMVFAGLKSESEIADLIAWLAQFDATGKKPGG